MSRISLRLAAVAAAGLLVGDAFAPAFGSPMAGPADIPGPLLLAVLVTVVSAAAAVCLCRAVRRGPVIAAIAGLALVAAAVASTVRPGADVLSGPYRLLTTALPADPHGPELAAIAALTGLITLVSSLIAAYSTWQVSALIPPVVGLVAAAGLDAGAGEPPAWFAATAVGVLGVVMAALRHSPADTAVPSRLSRTRRTLRSSRRIATVLIVLTSASVLALWTVPVLPGVEGQPADARALVSPPIQPRTDVNPLQQYTALRTDLKRVRISGTSSARLDRLRLLALDQFTGSYWTTTARYRRAGQRLAIRPSGNEVAVHLTVDAPGPLSWLLQPGLPHTVSVPNLGLNESTGDIVIPPGQPYPSAYDISGTTIPVSSSQLEADTPQELPSSHRQVSVPDDIRRFADRAKKAPSGYPRLLTLQRQLNAPGFVADKEIDAPGGNGYYQVLRLLRGSDGKHTGTSEQYASAFAIMARVLGYDARVVLGFTPEYVDDGHFTISGKNVRAWTEVRFARAGWVTFDPTPTTTNESPPPSPDSGTKPEETGSKAQQDNTATNSNDHAPRPASPIVQGSIQPTNNSASKAFRLTLFVVLAIVTLIVLLTLSPAVKAIRRRIRRAARPQARAIYGAWLETLDRLVERGFRVDRRATPRETAAKTPVAVRQHMRQLAELLDEACYAPEGATSKAPQAAWDNYQTVHDILHEDTKWTKLMVAAVNPRSIWRMGLSRERAFPPLFIRRLRRPPSSPPT